MMSPLTSPSARPCVVERRRSLAARVRAYAIVPLSIALLSCTRPAPPAPPDLAKGDSPEAKLERVIKRLKFALQSAEGAGTYGVVSKRQCRYRLIPPHDKETRHTAEVVILTTVALSDEPGSPIKPAPGANSDQSPTPTTEEEKFLLVLKGDRWQMPDKPESETLKICFDAALEEE